METTKDIKRRIEELEIQRKAISKEIRQLKQIIWSREHYKPSKNENSLVWQTFGKSVKDLTPIELKKYNAMRQAKTRKKKNNQ
jgi:hypothetical protein